MIHSSLNKFYLKNFKNTNTKYVVNFLNIEIGFNNLLVMTMVRFKFEHELFVHKCIFVQEITPKAL